MCFNDEEARTYKIETMLRPSMTSRESFQSIILNNFCL